MPEHPLSDRVALVTGASSGIGRASAEALGREGAAVGLAARRRGALESVADGIDAETAVVPTDVTDESQVEAAVERLVDAFGRLDVVVANAGVLLGGDPETMSTGDYRAMTRTNVDGTFFTARAALPHLRDAGGVIVFVGSDAACAPLASNPVYAATKWWVRGFAKSLAASLGEAVAVAVVNPSTTRTEMGADTGGANRDRYAPGEKLEPDEVAEAVVFAARHPAPTAVNELNLFRQDDLAQL